MMEVRRIDKGDDKGYIGVSTELFSIEKMVRSAVWKDSSTKLRFAKVDSTAREGC
jgi:hypothetical protein